MDARSHISAVCILVLLSVASAALAETPIAARTVTSPPRGTAQLSDGIWQSNASVDGSPIAMASYRTRVPAISEESPEPERVAEQTRTDVKTAERREEEAGDDEEAVPAALLGPQWHEAGPITAEYLYTGEVFNNAHGGISTQRATRYRGNFDLTLHLDTEAAHWWNGGQVFVYMQQSHGTTLTPQFVGDAQYYSNLDTSPKPQDVTELGEYWYQHTFGDDLVSVKMGRQDANADFAFADLGGDFINSSFTTLANIPMPFWPFQTLGISTLYQPSKKLRLGGGMYDQGHDENQWWMVTTSRGMFWIGQADYQPGADCEAALLTVLRVGAWYTTSDTLATDASTEYEGNYGFYGTVDRMLLPEAEDREQGLAAFCQASWAPPDRNLVDRCFGAGLVYRGLIPERDTDTLGLGFTQIAFSSNVRTSTGQTSENALELFYKLRLREWLAIEPDLQYIVRPSGLERDALVAGVRCEAAF
jgi:porin